MKKLITDVKPGLRLCAMLLAAGALLYACRPDADYYKPSPSRAGTLLTELQKDPDYSLFTQALDRTNFTPAFGGGAGLYTVFAPTNQGFQDFLTANGYKTLTDVPSVLLTKFVANHIIPSALLYTYDFQSQQFNAKKDNRYATLGDKYLTVNYQSKDNFTINGVKVLSTDDGTGNGVLYKIEKALTPQKSLDSLLSTSANYSEFYKLVAKFKTKFLDPRIQPNPRPRPSGTGVDSIFVTQYGLSSNVASDANLLTMFAPTNDAMAAFLKTTPYARTEDIPLPMARLLVEYHIVPPKDPNVFSPAIPASGLKTGDTLTTSFGEKLVVGRDLKAADLTQADQVVSNGYLHGINRVLLPPSFQTALGRAFFDPDLTLFSLLATKGDGFNVLTYGTQLLGITNPVGQYTVLAPTNAALAKLGLNTAKINALSAGDKDRILRSHVLTQTLPSTALKPGTTYATAYTDDKKVNKTVSYKAAGKFVSDAGAEVNIVKADVKGTVGVLHAIDGVLTDK